MEDYTTYIEEMIETIKSYGLSDDKIFKAMREVPRHLFVKDHSLRDTYGDYPLVILHGQTISQPYTVAFMLHLLSLKEGQRVLEIGTGSGWNAALIKKIIGDNGIVVSIELLRDLHEYAKKRINELSIPVILVHGDGSQGYKKYAPYDRIIITAACPEIPSVIVDQLKDGGVVVAPVGKFTQVIVVGEKNKKTLSTKSFGVFRFVPLKGKHGFNDDFF
ncbi:MAG: protein-L-isoaspartate(D-aspartate) O-methyltransferase [Candidatus Woesearchaeota archaeon]